MAQLGLLPWTHTFAFSGTNSYLVAFCELDADYEIDEVGVAIDSNGVTSATFSASIGTVSRGSDVSAGGKGTASSTTEGAIPAVGQLRVGLLQDILDPTLKGLNTVKLLSLVGLNNIWRIPDRQPIVHAGEVLCLIVINSTKANSGTVVIQVNGHQIARER